MDEPLPVVRGTLDLLVLKALAWTPMHGFEVTQWIEERAGGSLGFDESAVYQALYRLEKRGLVDAAWGVTENNRRARYYRMRPEGTEHLRRETEKLLRYGETVGRILGGAPKGART